MEWDKNPTTRARTTSTEETVQAVRPAVNHTPASPIMTKDHVKDEGIPAISEAGGAVEVEGIQAVWGKYGKYLLWTG